MKAWKIKIARKKIKNKIFLLRKLRYWAGEEKRLKRFYDFKCSKFFEGETMAEINLEFYNEKYYICRKNINRFKRILSALPK